MVTVRAADRPVAAAASSRANVRSVAGRTSATARSIGRRASRRQTKNYSELRPIAFAHSVVRLASSKAVASSLRLMVPANMRYTIKQRHQITIAATKL